MPGSRRVYTQQTLIYFACWLARLDAKLALQDSDAGMIDPQCAGAVVVQRQQAHQIAIGRLVDRVVLEQVLRVANRCGVVAPRLQEIESAAQALADG